MGRAWNRSVLDKVRLGALGFGLFTCVGPLNVLDGAPPLGRRLVSVGCILALAVIFVVTWRRNGTFRGEALVVAPLSLGASYGLSDSMIVIGTLLGVAVAQSLYGSTVAFAVRTVSLIPVVSLAVTFTDSFGRNLTWSSSQVLSQCILAPLAAVLVRTLRSALQAQEQAAARERIVATTGQALLGLTDAADVRAVMSRAGAELCRVTPELVIVTAAMSGGRLTVTGAHGMPPMEAELPLELTRVTGRHLRTAPLPAEYLPTVRAALGVDRHWHVMGLALEESARRDDLALVGLGDRTPEGALTLLMTLGGQRTLAERACRAHGELAHQAHHDDLTGLPNRALLFQQLDRALEDARAGRRSPVVLMVVDLDGFKSVNDSRGHAAGDVVLIEVGLRMRAVVAGAGLSARLGGDEFAVLLSGFAVESATEVGERLWARLCEPIELPDGAGSVRIGASIGLAVAAAETDAGKLMGLADVAMYAAKTSGHGGVEVFAPTPYPGAARSFPVSS